MTYRVELIQSEEGYAVSCPSLPGCHSQGETEEEALENIRSAISEYLEWKREEGARKQVRYVDVPLPQLTAFEVEPIEGLTWPEELNKSDKVSDWIAYLESPERDARS